MNEGNIRIEHFKDLDLAPLSFRNAVWTLLRAADHEFVPPLSARSGPTDSAFPEERDSSGDGPVSYFEEMRRQEFLIAECDGQVLGFISYKVNYRVPEIDRTVDAYVSTMIVAARARGRNLGWKFYTTLFSRVRGTEQTGAVWVATRTWHTNSSHIRILEKAGFECVYRKPGGRGNGVDTVVYLKDVSDWSEPPG